MADLTLFVDYDNLQATHTSAGPVNLGRMLVSLLPSSVLARYSSATVRLYGGWRSKANLTRLAQRLIPDIRQNSPAIFRVLHEGNTITLRLIIELADKPIGTSSPFEETLVFDRDLRKFRTKSFPWNNCASAGNCGFSTFAATTHYSPCGNSSCAVRLGELFIRDEQKMVDTLIVADVAQRVHVAKANDIVMVSSDTDMWPGVLLALRAGCNVTHIHTKNGWRTQSHLMRTISRPLDRQYNQMSV